ncbi:methionyl-tRNA formyltransferase [Agrococcus sp. SCSIO52902]|uniref:methionyl-tRNA formyltransferase n=1 Tax=Agrococcus sp. SCSIO52902 TaxID=2933290 RepID=UPI001FF1F605|nr:methionyl-tRNA formyltransferase [Agrococcus sp. SCSIO52902]UOW00509.1 methionyl-tRNA formyltransferase [Agrococcus sp. SCSIO52902]
MRIVFAGSPAAAVPSLEALARAHEVAAVVTRAASPQGRRRVLTPTPVAARAAELGLPVIEADRLDAAATTAIEALGAELGVIVAYGGLVREPLLSAPAHGWINLHFSLLPDYRGAAPVQRALIDGRGVTGVSVFRLVEALDAGPVVRMREAGIPEGATAGALLEQLAELGAHELVEAVDAIEAGTAVFEEQTGAPSFAPKLTLADGALDLAATAPAVLARWRGVTPEPGAHAVVDGERVKLLALARSGAEPMPPGRAVLAGRAAIVGTGSAPLELREVQPAGRRPMPGADWLRGRGGSADFEVAS